MRALMLKIGTTLITLATTVSAAVYVNSHLKNPGAPLQPPVLAGRGFDVTLPGGGLSLRPSVSESPVPAVTSTYAS